MEMPTEPPGERRRRLLAMFLLPPLGLVLLWRSPQATWRKCLGTLGMASISLLYVYLICVLLVKLHLAEVEWSGGFGPRLVHRRTKPDFDALDANRRAQKNAPVVAPSGGSTYWTSFRGPNRDGQYTQQPILTNWPKDGLRCVWRQPCGGGYASFAVAEGRAFTIEQRREQEAVVAYDVATGRELWSFAYAAQFNDQYDMGGVGPRSTPTWDEGRIFASGASGQLHCLDAASGKLIWKRDTLTDSGTTVLQFGMAASPLIAGDKLIVTMGEVQDDRSRGVIAYQKTTGEPLWKSQTDKQAYTSPMLVTLAGRSQLLLGAGKRALALAPEDGALLWEFPWTVQYDNQIAQPVLAGNDRVLLSGGYGAGCVAFQVTKNGASLKTTELWRNKHLKNKFTSSVLYGGHVYGLDEDILVCLDLATGERKWKDGRYGYGQLLLASGHLVILCGDGDLALVKASPDKHEELARVPGIKGKTWNHPAIADGKLLVRNAVEMACYDLSVK